MSTKWPAIAAAAAIAGLTRCVRPPAPCRPSKLRFEVDAQRSPGVQACRRSCRGTSSSRARATRSRRRGRPCRGLPSRPAPSPGPSPAPPSPGGCSARLRRPFTTAAAARRSSMRELVHEPMKILSSVMSVIARARLEAHVDERALHALAPGRVLLACPDRARASSTDTTISGEVPQVTCGVISRASSVTSRSNFASGSLFSVRQ